MAPVGVPKLYEIVSPIIKLIMEIMTEMIVLARKVFAKHIADRHGNTMRLDISSAPRMRMPIMIVREHKTARMVL